MKTKIFSLGAAGSLSMVLMFQNCGSFDAGVIDPEKKLNVLSSNSVFDASVRKPVNLDILVSGQAPAPFRTSIPVTGTAPASTSIPVSGREPASATIPVSGTAPNTATLPVSGMAPTATYVPASGGSSMPVVSSTSVQNIGRTVASVSATGSMPVKSASLTSTVGKDIAALSHLCSDMRSGAKGNLAMPEEDVYAIFLNSSVSGTKKSMPVCVFTAPEIKTEILSGQKKLKMETVSDAMARGNCPSLVNGGSYSLHAYKPSKIDLINKSGDLSAFATFLGKQTSAARVNLSLFSVNLISMNSVLKVQDSVVEVLVDFNNQNHITTLNCDRRASPLLVQFHSDVNRPQGLVLTSQAQGVNFDILGKNADPVPHHLKRISWHRSLDYYYITLPNSKGQVQGIDQLFGDNTQGPDGNFATDGYAALAKFDGTSADGRTQIGEADGLITEQDPVFEKLRLWQDRNFDGKAQASELLSLRAMNVQIIDLSYDGSFSETDVYGNQTMYKSVVKTNDGRYHLMFDLWFAWQEILGVQTARAW